MSSDWPPSTFAEWSAAWLTEGRYKDATCDPADLERKIDRVITLWNGPIPSDWQRDLDPRILGGDRDLRNPAGVPSETGEHALEIEVLGENHEPLAPAVCLGGQLIDGFNALPLSKDPGGHRDGNVEADLLLLTKTPDGYRQLLLEVKTTADHPFYALVENLRQLKLFLATDHTQTVFSHRQQALGVPKHLPVTAAVLSRASGYYDAEHKKRNAVPYAYRLIERIEPYLPSGTILDLAVWDADTRAVTAYDAPSAT